MEEVIWRTNEMSEALVESLKKYSETLPEADSEAILKSCRNSAGILGRSSFPDYSDLADLLTEKYPVLFGGSSWMRLEVDRAVLEKLIERAKERTLRKKVLGKATRKKFGIRKYRKYAGSPRK